MNQHKLFHSSRLTDLVDFYIFIKGITMWEIISFADKPFGSIGKRNIKKKLGETGIPLEEPFDYLDTRSDRAKSREFKDLYYEVMW